MTQTMIRRTGSLPAPHVIPPQVSDPRRLAAVRDSGLLDTPPEDIFDDLARLAAVITGVPLAFVTVVDDTRSFWKSTIGLDVPDLTQRQNPVQDSFCKYVIAAGGPVILDDVPSDPRVRDNPTVAHLDIGAWAGYPIHAPGGEIVGGFCVISHEPRQWTDRELHTLATLSRAVSNEIALRAALTIAQQRLDEMARAHDNTLRLARTLQAGLLPPTLPDVPGVPVASYYQAAGGAEVIGDFYDLFHVTDQWWCAVIGDVCGHGVEAAQVTALARHTLRATAILREQPSAVLANLDRAMVAQNGVDGRYLTAAYLTFRLTDTGIDGRLCLAGHPKPVIRRTDGTIERIGTPGSILGALPQLKLFDVDFHLDPGDLLLLYTDGITERRSPHDAFFGEVEFDRAIAATTDLSAPQTVAHVAAAADTFGHGRCDDDTALLVIQPR